MKLLAYKIDGKIINKEIFNWTISDLNGNKPWLVSEFDLPNYVDISSIEDWDNLSTQIDKDYLFIRQRIKELVNEFIYVDKYGVERYNSERLNLIDSTISSKYFLISKSLRDNFLSEIDQQFWWRVLIENSQQSRQIRWEAAKTWISYNLPPIDSSDLAKSTTQLCSDYVNYNIISKSKDGVSGLFDYLTGVEDYSTSGFPSKSYWSQIYQDKLMDIIENGNY
jgi:hypothetical protein